MPCRTDMCPKCDDFYCGGFTPGVPCKNAKKIKKKKSSLDFEGALCDALTIIEDNDLLKLVDKEVMNWWNKHQSKENEKIKQEALAKLSVKEKRALGLK